MTATTPVALVIKKGSLTTRAVVSNAKTWGEKVSGRFLLPGLIAYKDVNGKTAYLAKETIDRCVKTFEAKPFSMHHDAENIFTGERMGDPAPENLEYVAVGYIHRVWFNPEDGWYWFDGTVHNDEAKKRIDEGWGVSCTYTPTEAPGPGATLNGVSYDYETRGFFGESIAIEPKDRIRYEGAKIFKVRNSKPKTGAPTMFKFFTKTKKQLTEAELQKAADLEKDAQTKLDEAKRIRNAVPAEEATEISPDTEVTVDDKGTKVAFKDVLAGYQANQDQVRNAMTEVEPETEIEYTPGKKEKLGVMCAHYSKHMAENEETEKKEAARRHAEDEEKKKKDEAARNAKQPIKLSNYDRVLHASTRTATNEPTRKTSQNSVEAQKERGKANWSLPARN